MVCGLDQNSGAVSANNKSQLMDMNMVLVVHKFQTTLLFSVTLEGLMQILVQLSQEKQILKYDFPFHVTQFKDTFT